MSFASSTPGSFDSKNTSNENENTSKTSASSIMSALYSNRQSGHQTQQLAMQQRKDKEEEDAVLRYQRYLQQHQQQQQQRIPQTNISAKPTPPSITNHQVVASIEVINNINNSNKNPNSNDKPTTIVFNNPNLSPSGIPEPKSPASQIARVDFAGDITTADNEEVSPATPWQNFLSSSIATATTNTANAIKAATSSPPRANSTRRSPAPLRNPSVNNTNRGAIASSAPPRTSPIPKLSTTSTSTSTNPGSTLLFAPDIVVGIGGNTKITDANRAKYHGRTAAGGISYFPMQSPSLLRFCIQLNFTQVFE